MKDLVGTWVKSFWKPFLALDNLARNAKGGQVNGHWSALCQVGAKAAV